MYDTSARSVGSPTCATALRISLLGPVEVSVEGTDVTLSPLELNLLVLLAVTPGVAVSTERLVDHLWGSDLPVAPRSRVQGLVSGLRRKIGAPLAVFASAAIFALLHFRFLSHGGVEGWVYTATIAAVGLVTATLALRTGSLWGPFAVHAGYNAAIISFVAVSPLLLR